MAIIPGNYYTRTNAFSCSKVTVHSVSPDYFIPITGYLIIKKIEKLKPTPV